MTLQEIQNEVIRKYHITIDTDSKCRQRMHAHVKERRICKWKQKNSIQATFDLLHEIGHIETTKSKMRRMEAELYATVWAIDKCREYGLEIPRSVWNTYHEYIKTELKRGQRRGGKHYPPIHLPEDIIEKEQL